MSVSLWKSLVQQIFSMAAHLTFQLHYCLAGLNTAADAGRHVCDTNTSSPAAHRVPTELIFHIIDLAAKAATTSGPLDFHSAYPVVPAKPDFAALVGLSGSCRTYHTAVQQAWYSILYVRTPDDWEMVDRLGVSIYVRQVHCWLCLIDSKVDTAFCPTGKFESSQAH
ncbi:hypothetical protein BDV93DRAFT_561991 [Ceratobasidium sp. AG-I]|nr:hypothetical protein BDV93DRAFT_561991 [Ceratobasidium sp. AG-I]